MAIKSRTVQEGKIMLIAENGCRPGDLRKETWAIVPPELGLAEGAVVDIRGWNHVKWDNTQAWVIALWKPTDKEPTQMMCEKFFREYYLGQMVAEEYFPVKNYLFDVRKTLRVRDKEIIKKIDDMYKWREDDDKVWCSPNAKDEPYTPVAKKHLSLRKRLKLAGKDSDEV